MKSSFRDSADNAADRRTVIVERLNGSFGFTLQVSPRLKEEIQHETMTNEYISRSLIELRHSLSPGGGRSGHDLCGFCGSKLECSQSGTAIR